MDSNVSNMDIVNVASQKQIGRTYPTAYKELLSCLGKTVHLTVMKVCSFSVIVQENTSTYLKLMVQFIHIMDCVTLNKTVLNT